MLEAQDQRCVPTERYCATRVRVRFDEHGHFRGSPIEFKVLDVE